MEEDILENKQVENSPEEKPKKKTNGCLIAFLVFLFLILLMAGGVYWGYKKVINAMEPVELGVTYSEEDYDSLMNNLGLDADPSTLCIDCEIPTFSDPQQVSLTVSNEQASAAFEYINQYLSMASISGTQIKMNNGSAELSTMLTYNGQTFPIYISGTIAKNSENTITGGIYELDAGGLNVPENVKTLVSNLLVNIANEKLISAGENVRIDSLEITEDGLNFEGLVPTKAE